MAITLSKTAKTKRTKSKQPPKKQPGAAAAASGRFPTGLLWWGILSLFMAFAAFPILMNRLTEDLSLSSAHLAPLAVWCGTAILAFWFSRPRIFSGDRPFVVLTLFLFGLGIVEQLRLETFHATWHLWRAYAPMLAGAAGFLFCLRFLKAHHFERLLALKPMEGMLWCAIMGVLGLLFCFGRSYRGGMFLPGQINPTELIKLLTVLLGATVLTRLNTSLSRTCCFLPMPPLTALIQLAFFWGAPLLGVVMVRDLGLVLILCLTYVTLLTVLTRNPLWLLFGLGGAAAAGFAVCSISAHTATRFAIWQNPFADPLGKGYQILQSLCAMNAGGMTGTGLNQGMPGAVPIVTSDFVYAAIAEEWGLIGCALLFCLYTLWLQRIFRIGAQSERLPLKLTAAGIGAVLGVQIILNVGGVTKALPMTGITLPFLSHGGFSLLTVFLLCGVAVALSKQE